MKQSQYTVMTSKCIFTVLCIVGFSIQSAQAQYYQKKAGFATTFNASAYATPANDFKDTTGNFAYNQYNAGMVLPLFGRVTIKEKGAKPKLFQLFLSAGMTAGKPEINFEYTFRNRTLYNASAGLTALYYYGNRNTLLGGVYSFIGEDNKTLKSSIEPRFAGFLLFNHYVKDKKYSYKFGALYTYLFGRDIVLPVGGITLDISKKSRLNILVPLTLSYSYTNEEGNRFRLFVKPRGSYNNFNNEDEDMQFNNGQIPVIQVRQAQVRAGVDAKLKLHDNFFLKIETGVTIYDNLLFFNEGTIFNPTLFAAPEPLYETDIKPGVYLQLGFSWKIKRKIKPLFQKLTYLIHPDLLVLL